MRLLIDTHVLIWYVDQDHRLSRIAHAAVSDSSNDICVSAASIWEISIKVGLGKLTLTQPFRDWMGKAIADLGATILPISVAHGDVQIALPLHHRDPFDRLLIAQALAEKIPIVSQDLEFDAYGVERIW